MLGFDLVGLAVQLGPLEVLTQSTVKVGCSGVQTVETGGRLRLLEHRSLLLSPRVRLAIGSRVALPLWYLLLKVSSLSAEPATS